MLSDYMRDYIKTNVDLYFKKEAFLEGHFKSRSPSHHLEGIEGFKSQSQLF